LPAQRKEESSDFVDGERLLRILEEDKYHLGDRGGTASLPKIRHMPEGVEVVEQRAGIAVGQWVLRVRCQCGRAWFELEAVKATTCPRCGLLVYVEVEAPIPQK